MNIDILIVCKEWRYEGLHFNLFTYFPTPYKSPLFELHSKSKFFLQPEKMPKLIKYIISPLVIVLGTTLVITWVRMLEIIWCLGCCSLRVNIHFHPRERKIIILIYKTNFCLCLNHIITFYFKTYIATVVLVNRLTHTSTKTGTHTQTKTDIHFILFS